MTDIMTASEWEDTAKALDKEVTRLKMEVEASRSLIRVLKKTNLDLHTSQGEMLERALMAYDRQLGLTPNEVRS